MDMRSFGSIALAAAVGLGSAGCLAGIDDDDDAEGEIAAASSPLLLSSTALVSFGNVKVGCTERRSVTITNNSSLSVTINSITASPSVFGKGSFPGSLPSGGSANLGVGFTPAAEVSYTGSVTIRSTLSNGVEQPSLVIGLEGNGFPPDPC